MDKEPEKPIEPLPPISPLLRLQIKRDYLAGIGFQGLVEKYQVDKRVIRACLFD
jgi:hypothetical protein